MVTKELIIIYGVAFVGLVVLFAISLTATVNLMHEGYQIQKACEAQGGIYLNSECKKPSEIITPK